MTRTKNELFELLNLAGYISPLNALKICPENPRVFECEYIWADPINEQVKVVGWNKRMGEPTINTFESKCVGISPLRGIQILNTLRKGGNVSEYRF